MKKQMALLLGSAAAMMAFGAAHATIPPSPPSAALAVNSYADLLEPVPNAVAAVTADDLSRAQAPKSRIQLAQYHHHHHHSSYHHHHHHSSFFPGFAIGAAIGSMMAAPPPPPSHYYARSVEWCMHHYRSYDPRSKTYLGYDGRRHPCP